MPHNHVVQSDMKVTRELLVGVGWLEFLRPLSSPTSKKQKGAYLHVESQVILSLEYLFCIISLLNIFTLTSIKGYHSHRISHVNSCLIEVTFCPPLNFAFPFC